MHDATPQKPQSPPQDQEEVFLTRRARRWILVLNTLGFALFLAWLISLKGQPIMREQEGILYFLPCLPFLFVYLMMMPRKKPPTPPAPDGKADAADADGSADADASDGKPAPHR